MSESLLDKIISPAQLRLLEPEQLPQLAAELRQEIIRVTSVNGGHLASNLGVVELTLALHYVLDTPEDKLIWDVGHQCYAHKLLTGRREGFQRLRQEDGVSGFCNSRESAYDCFITGHSSNSLSLALGLAQARDLAGRQEKVVAVIGDGALTGGMAYEALNNAGGAKTRLVVVLNDNGMSIGGNVGGLASYLSDLRSGAKYNRFKEKAAAALMKIPLLGPALLRFGRGLKHSLKSVIISPGMFFENLGFVYLGPADGHDINSLIELLRRSLVLDKPVLIHVKTTKGKGYGPAEIDPIFYHGVNRFDLGSGVAIASDSRQTYTDVFSDAIMGVAMDDPEVVAITAAMSHGSGLSEFARRWPERFFDVGIAEQHAVSFAAGLAAGGKKPVVAIYSCFLQRAYDQIIDDVCLQRLPVVFAIDRAGVVGHDGASHQGAFDLTYLRSIPGLTIMAPADGRELRSMLHAAVSWGMPIAIRYPRDGVTELPMLPEPLTLGQASLLRAGDDMAFFAIGSMVAPALAAAQLLSQAGVEARVINARFAAPLDKETLFQTMREVRGRVMTVEENSIHGGFGSACAEALAGLGIAPMIAALPDRFIDHGQRSRQLSALGLDGPGLARAACAKWFPGRSIDDEQR